jgi:hypothetical protein
MEMIRVLVLFGFVASTLAIEFPDGKTLKINLHKHPKHQGMYVHTFGFIYFIFSPRKNYPLGSHFFIWMGPKYFRHFCI